MQCNQDYVVDSLELHLFFARIMKEHALFLKAGFMPPGAAFARESEMFLRRFEAILSRAVSLSNHIVRRCVLDSGEVFTRFTDKAECRTQRLTGIAIDRQLTARAMCLSGSDCGAVGVSGVKEAGLNLAVSLYLKEELEALYPGKFEFTACRNSYDYIYTVEELSELHGKKLQSKRNHCNRFEDEFPDWFTAPITDDNLPQCHEMLRVWYETHEPAVNAQELDQLQLEKTALQRAFDHFDELEMDGLLLSDGERIIAFSMGSRMNRDYYDVGFEKAFPDVNGAYAMINREFSRMIAEKYPEVQFLNREDDMGSEGLRRAKESYQPTVLLEKYVADWKEN